MEQDSTDQTVVKQPNEIQRVRNGKETSNGNRVELQRLSLLRSYVDTRDSSSKGVDDLTLRRFLRARDMDVEKAGVMFLKYLKWKREFLPKGFISENEVKYDISHNKMFVGGVDKKGRPILVVFVGRHFQNPNPGGLDELKRYITYTLEKICARMPVGQEKFLSIADCQGWGFSNSDLRGYIGALSVLQECYPERLGKLFMVRAPKIFMTVWKMVYPFIDNHTKSKIVFVKEKVLQSTLLEEIDESQLPDVYGGKSPLVPIQETRYSSHVTQSMKWIYLS